MKPTEFENQLDAYVMGELTADEVIELQQLAQENSDYGQALAEAEQLMKIISGMPKEEPSARVRAGFLDNVLTGV